MKSVLNNIIWILLSLNVHFLKYPEVLCANIPETDAKCTFDNVRAEDQPVFAHVIFRHGERNIEKSFPNDPYKDESHWPGGFGALTKEGKKEVYELGKYLRRKYSNLVGKLYSPKDVYIHSTDFDRTLMSAQVLAAGLFPAHGDQIWNKDINWIPIPIHSRRVSEEQLLPWMIPCPRFTYLIKQYKSSPEYKSILAKYKPSIKHWEKHSGQPLKELVDIMYLHDTLYVENRRGLALDDWADKAINSDSTLEYLAAFQKQTFTNSIELKKLQAGFIIKEMLDRFQNKSQSLLEPDRSLWIYSAHDITIVSILNALSLFDLHIPPYASSVHFELYQNGTDYYVQLFYRNENQETVEPLEIPNCGTRCQLDRFYELYKAILPTKFEDYDSACRISD